MKSSPIYNIINNPGRKSDCSFGSTDGYSQDIRVGTSARNSHTLADITVKRHVRDDGSIWFALFVDDKYVKGGLLTGKHYQDCGSERLQ